MAGESGSRASTLSVDTRSSRPPRSRPAAGSSSSSSSGSVISARAIWTRLRSPSLRVPKVRSTRCAAPDLAEQVGGPVVVERVVLLAPAAQHAVRRGHDDVLHQLAARDPVGEGGAGQADAGTQVEDVDGAEHLAEDARDAGGRVQLGRGDLQQGGLAGAVGADQHPALVLLDRPVDVVEQRRLATAHRETCTLDHGAHAAHPIQRGPRSRRPRRIVSSRVTRTPPVRPPRLVDDRLAARRRGHRPRPRRRHPRRPRARGGGPARRRYDAARRLRRGPAHRRRPGRTGPAGRG